MTQNVIWGPGENRPECHKGPRAKMDQNVIRGPGENRPKCHKGPAYPSKGILTVGWDGMAWGGVGDLCFCQHVYLIAYLSAQSSVRPIDRRSIRPMDRSFVRPIDRSVAQLDRSIVHPSDRSSVRWIDHEQAA